MCLDPGTRQSDHMGLSCAILRTVPVRHTAKLPHFAVCLGPWHTAKIGTSPCVSQILAHGEVGSRRRHPRAVTVPAPAPPSVTLICRVPPLAPDKRHTAKWALPLRLVAVEHLPWAAHGEPICRVLCGLRRVPWAHGKWPESGIQADKLVSSCRVYIYC